MASGETFKSCLIAQSGFGNGFQSGVRKKSWRDGVNEANRTTISELPRLHSSGSGGATSTGTNVVAGGSLSN